MGKEKLDKILQSLEKNYNAKKAKDIKKDEIISTGIFPLDYVLSGGIHLGEGGHRIEFFGAESSAKTTFALHVIKQFQKKDKICVFMDAENSYDKEWAEIVGVDNSKLIIVKPASLEEMGDLFVKLIPEVDLIVIDSIVSMLPEAEGERDTNQPTMGLQARINAIICRKIYDAISKSPTTMIFINQLREKIGVMYGNPFTTGGGRALKHMYNTRVYFRAGTPIDIGTGTKKDRIGIEINLKCTKNKKGTPWKTSVIEFYFTGELNNAKSLLFSAVKYGIVEQKGPYYKYNDIKEQGKDKFCAKLSEKDWKKIEREIWKRLK